MGMFEKFDAKVNMEAIEKQKAEANSYEETPAGRYIARIEKMELGTTKDGRPMFKVQMRLVEGAEAKTEKFLLKYKNKKPCIFMNRVIFGTKNDGNMIASVEGWLRKLELDGDPIVFSGYDNFADDILDAAEACDGLEFEVVYDDSKFNSIEIKDVFDA